MTTMDNKVKFNLHNVHYIVLNRDTLEPLPDAKPKPTKGAVSLSLDPQGEMQQEYADGVVWYSSYNNAGYSGNLEFENVTDEMRTDVWGDTLDANKVLIENANAEPNPIALLYQIDGDKYNRCMALYNVALNRPGIGSSTNQGNQKSIQHDTCAITASPNLDGTVKACTSKDTTADVIKAWFTKLYKKA